MNKFFEIESNIPVPAIKPGRPKYPFRQLAVSESFLVPCGDYEKPEAMNSLTSCRAHAQRKTGWKFVMRSVTGGIRVWRIA